MGGEEYSLPEAEYQRMKRRRDLSRSG
ncbi:MAG: hypothetical protein JWM11_8087, partial [Planctomycetaceae bacterium]|nr:hypothetical protein [Planctomycetaceae bacterium]